jgi:hypothetical protein
MGDHSMGRPVDGSSFHPVGSGRSAPRSPRCPPRDLLSARSSSHFRRCKAFKVWHAAANTFCNANFPGRPDQGDLRASTEWRAALGSERGPARDDLPYRRPVRGRSRVQTSYAGSGGDRRPHRHRREATGVGGHVASRGDIVLARTAKRRDRGRAETDHWLRQEVEGVSTCGSHPAKRQWRQTRSARRQ